MFRPYPQIRPPVNGLTAFRDRLAWLRWFARPGPALIAVALGGWTLVGLIVWAVLFAASVFHPSIDVN